MPVDYHRVIYSDLSWCRGCHALYVYRLYSDFFCAEFSTEGGGSRRSRDHVFGRFKFVWSRVAPAGPADEKRSELSVSHINPHHTHAPSSFVFAKVVRGKVRGRWCSCLCLWHQITSGQVTSSNRCRALDPSIIGEAATHYRGQQRSLR